MFKDSKDEMLDEIKGIIINFLKENGGYDNGYDTYVKGRVEPCWVHPLEWRTPGMSDMTYKEVSDKGYELNKTLTKCFKNGINVIIIEARYEDYGTYHMRIIVGREASF